MGVRPHPLYLYTNAPLKYTQIHTFAYLSCRALCQLCPYSSKVYYSFSQPHVKVITRLDCGTLQSWVNRGPRAAVHTADTTAAIALVISLSKDIYYTRPARMISVIFLHKSCISESGPTPPSYNQCFIIPKPRELLQFSTDDIISQLMM